MSAGRDVVQPNTAAEAVWSVPGVSVCPVGAGCPGAVLSAARDAALIAASAEFCRTMDRLDACTYDAEAGTPVEVEAEREQEELCLQLRAIAERMARMKATTDRGLAARAVAMGRADALHAFDYEGPGTTARIMLDALLRDGAASLRE